MSMRILINVGFLLAFLACRSGQAQLCVPRWSDEFQSQSLSHSAWVGAMFDDGGGPTLYVGGIVQRAGPNFTTGVVRWSGSEWQPLPPSPDWQNRLVVVYALVEYDDGNGPGLYAATILEPQGVPDTRQAALSRWRGGQWTTIARFSGSSGGVGANALRALAVHDDGSGPALYVGGQFDRVLNGPVVGYGVARYRDGQWSGLGAGVGSFNTQVNCMASFDDGSGPELFVGGRFLSASGVPARHIARWDGRAWHALGDGVTPAPGISDPVSCVAALNLGDGPALYVGGHFDMVGATPATNIAKWDGHAWSALGQGLPSIWTISGVHALAKLTTDAGPRLFAGGELLASAISAWDGTSWTPLGAGVGNGAPTSVGALVPSTGASGPVLHVLGDFRQAGGAPASNYATWSAAGWSAPSPGVVGSYVSRLRAIDTAEGPSLEVCGDFTSINDSLAASFALRTSEGWQAMGAQTQPIYDAALFNDGHGSRFYAAGSYDLLRRDGSAWVSAVHYDQSAVPGVLRTYDDGTGSALYLAGSFTSINGISVQGVAKWDGASVLPVGGGLPGVVYELLDANLPGIGSRLVACGASGPAATLAAWDGTAWQTFAAPIQAATSTPSVRAMCMFDDGSGPELFVAGRFSIAGQTPASNIAKWNGSAWTALGAGVAGGEVYAMAPFDDGRGPSLFVAGTFTSAGGLAAGFVARWDGRGWSGVDSGLNGRALTIAAFDDGRGPSLWIGGDFTTGGGVNSGRLARWIACRGCYANCDNSTGPGGLPTLSVADFACYLNRFAAGDPAANCDASSAAPTLNVLDFICFLNRFAAGCP